jgi:hypothetical protein
VDVGAGVESGVNFWVVVWEGKYFFGAVIETCQQYSLVLELGWGNRETVGAGQLFYLSS